MTDEPAITNDVLIQGWLEGDLDPAGCRLLLERLRSDPGLIGDLRADWQLDGLLRAQARRRVVAHPAPLTTTRHRRPHQRRTALPFPTAWWLAALAAGVVLAIVVIGHGATTPAPASPPVVVIPGPASPPTARDDRASAHVDHLAPATTQAVLVGADASRRRLAIGMALRSGDRIETQDAGQVRVVFAADRTRVDLGPDSIWTMVDAEGAKHLRLDRGHLEADVARQPAERPLTITTPQGVATVLGTRLSLSAQDDATRLAVTSGRVALRRAADAAPLIVEGGHYAVAGGGEAFAVRSLLPEAPLRLVDGHEAGLQWSHVRWGGPVELALVGGPVASGASAVRLAYRHAPLADGAPGYGMMSHALRPEVGDRSLAVRVFIEHADRQALINALVMLDDGSGWFLGDARLDQRPACAWFTFAVPIDRAKKKNNDAGGAVFDPSRIVSCLYSLYGGDAVVRCDDLMLSSERITSITGTPP